MSKPTDDLAVLWKAYRAEKEIAERLQEEVKSLRAALADAIEAVEFWSGYASDYFKDKHDLAGDMIRLHAALDRAST